MVMNPTGPRTRSAADVQNVIGVMTTKFPIGSHG